MMMMMMMMTTAATTSNLLLLLRVPWYLVAEDLAGCRAPERGRTRALANAGLGSPLPRK
jgi:hypothetical protein